MNDRMKAQVTFDFLIAIILALVLFTFIMHSVYDRQEEMQEIVRFTDARRTAEKLALAINDVYLSGDGSYMNVTLPETLHGGKAYNLTVYPRSVMVSYGEEETRDYSRKVLTKNINGSAGGLILAPGDIMIENVNGTIYLTK